MASNKDGLDDLASMSSLPAIGGDNFNSQMNAADKGDSKEKEKKEAE